MERRNRQSMNLNSSTSKIHRDSKKRHKGSIDQMDMFPNRWLRIGSKAQDKEVVFNNLLTHINVETLREAYSALDGTKALGIDGISKVAYGKNLDQKLEDLTRRIHVGSYKPQAKREVKIPKANGKTRPIAVGCFEDKLVEWVVGKILECVYEPIFIRNSFGFRPNKSPHNAVKATYYSLKDNKRPYAIEIDLASFFNSIPHRRMIKVLSKRISDRRFKGLIGRFMKGGVLINNELSTPEAGTPQCSIMSPILANVYLNEVIDQWFVDRYASYSNVIVRYADDSIFFFRKKEEAEEFYKDLFTRIKDYGLELNGEKTNMIDFSMKSNKHFSFLGFTFCWGMKKGRKRPLIVKTQKAKLLKKIQEFYYWIKSARSKFRLSRLWKLAISKLHGHYSYFGYWTNRSSLWHFYNEALKSLFKWLNRRSQKKSFNWDEFNRRLTFNPLPKPAEANNLRKLGSKRYA